MSPRMKRRMERGGVMTIIAVLLGGGVLLGMAAISLDVGRILVEKRQMQNAADAAAMSLAQSCVDGNCTAGANNLAGLADKNASDQTTGIQSQCAKNLPASLATDLAACASPTLNGNLTNCSDLPPNVDAGASYVEVRTRTESLNSSGTRTNGLTNFVAGMLGQSTSSAGACARAAWGPLVQYEGSLPLAISICEWQSYAGIDNVTAGLPSGLPAPPAGAWPGYNATGAGGQSQWPPAYAGWKNKVGYEQYVMTHSQETDCNFKGKDTAGGFGWLDNTACSTTIQVNLTGNYWAEIQTGNAVPQSCKDILHAYYGKTILVPIFDCMVKQSPLPTGGKDDQTSCAPADSGGAQTWYHILGFATFYMSGNKLSPSAGDLSIINNKLPCSSDSPAPTAPATNPWTGNSGRCLSGWFVNTDLLDPGSNHIGSNSGGGVNLGTQVIGPAG
jgi:Flp pilus assembly protein TadG